MGRKWGAILPGDPPDIPAPSTPPIDSKGYYIVIPGLQESLGEVAEFVGDPRVVTVGKWVGGVDNCLLLAGNLINALGTGSPRQSYDRIRSTTQTLKVKDGYSIDGQRRRAVLPFTWESRSTEAYHNSQWLQGPLIQSFQALHLTRLLFWLRIPFSW